MFDEYYSITKIDSNLYLSGAIKDYNKLQELGIKNVVNCRSEQHDDLSILADLGINYHYIPLPDAKSGRYDQMETFLKLMNEAKGPVLVHCMQGRGRAVMMTAVYLVIFYNKSPEEAIAIIKEKRSFIMPTEEQVTKLYSFREWYDAI